MEQFNFKSFDTNKRSKWLESKSDAVALLTSKLVEVRNNLTIEMDIIRWSNYDLEELAPKLLYYFASMQDRMAIESVIGGVASLLNPGKNREPLNVIRAHQTAGEIVLSMSLFVNVTKTYNDKLVVVSNITDSALVETEYFPLPTNEPMEETGELGKFSWSNTNDESLQILNNQQYTVIDFEEDEPSKDTAEKHSKWSVRKSMRSILADTPLYFKWNSDYRGRMYASGYHFNPQGTQYEKSIITFHEKIEMTPVGMKNLKLAIARAYGFDKLTDGAKLAWYWKNRNDLHTLIPKEPHTARKLLYALQQVKATGSTNMCAELDGTNSQLQMVSVLTGCKQTAKTCNVIPSDDGEIADAYGILASTMTVLAQIKGIKSVNN